MFNLTCLRLNFPQIFCHFCAKGIASEQVLRFLLNLRLKTFSRLTFAPQKDAMPKLFGTVYVQFFICTVLKADLHHTTENLPHIGMFPTCKDSGKIALVFTEKRLLPVFPQNTNSIIAPFGQFSQYLLPNRSLFCRRFCLRLQR